MNDRVYTINVLRIIEFLNLTLQNETCYMFKRIQTQVFMCDDKSLTQRSATCGSRTTD